MSDAQLIRFADLRGHDAAAAFLRNAVEGKRLAHSLLLAGPDGIGKRSLALAFTAWLQCADRTTDACASCPSCKQLAALTHPDVRIVSVPDGKKDIGVDHARDLKRWMSLRSARDRTKVALLLDAEMLTVAAQNALLKTLEEPPSGSMLILVSNNADALLPTVRSRCQRIAIRPLPEKAVEEVLSQRLAIPAPLAGELAALAEGSPGRALALQEILDDPRTADLLSELATHPSGRYVRVSQMAAALNSPESAAIQKLEFLLRRYRDQALASTPQAVQAIVRNSTTVTNALLALRRTNPNRQLLFEALLLQLSPASDSQP